MEEKNTGYVKLVYKNPKDYESKVYQHNPKDIKVTIRVEDGRLYASVQEGNEMCFTGTYNMAELFEYVKKEYPKHELSEISGEQSINQKSTLVVEVKK